LQYDRSYLFKDLNNLAEKDLEILSGGYVVINKRYLVADVFGRAIPHDQYYMKYAISPPNRWVNVVSFSGTPSYNSVDLYYVKAPKP